MAMRLQDLPLDCVEKVLMRWPRRTFPYACRRLCRIFAAATRDFVLISARSEIFWSELRLHAYFLEASRRRTAALTRAMDLVAFRVRHSDHDVESAVKQVRTIARTARTAGHTEAQIQGFVRFVNAVVKYTIHRLMYRAATLADEKRKADSVCRLDDDEYDSVQQVINGTATFQTLLAFAKLQWQRNPISGENLMNPPKGVAQQSERVLKRLTDAAAAAE
jgi:hypothetical protein